MNRVVKRIALVAGILISSAQVSHAQSIVVDPLLFSKGVELYNTNCAICHGANGDGKGPLASGFTPRPRDFTRGNFKFRSTDVGEPPTREDLMRTIRSGVEGSYGRSMPAFDTLTEEEVLALVEVTRAVAGLDELGTPVTVPPRPTTPDLARGATLYMAWSCIDCHGARGDGAGELAKNMLDANDLPIKPADFRVGKFKGGDAPEDLWMRIYSGLEGTPMPSFVAIAR